MEYRTVALRHTGLILLASLAAAPDVPAAPLDPTPELVLDRAITAMGGPAALEAVREIRIVWVGTQDLRAVYQSRYAEKSAPDRRQETLILDVPGRRGSLRFEGVQSDGTASMWRDTILGDEGYTINLKTQRTIDRAADDAHAIWERWLWSIPQLALRELSKRRAELRWKGRGDIDGRAMDVVAVDLPRRGPIRVWFDGETGLLAGYSWEGSFVEGSTTFRYRFKPYRKTGLGLFPSGFRYTIGERVFRDCDVHDVRLSKVAGDPWLTPRAKDAEPVLKIVKQKPIAEAVAPGVFILRNVGGYNVLVAAIGPGPCYAVFDAPASFDTNPPLPDTEPPPNLAKDVLSRAAEALPGKRLCWVVPTHHHGDHIGGAATLLAANPESILVVAPGSRPLAERVAGLAGGVARVRVVGDSPLTLGEGEERVEIYRVTDALHADELLLAYFPSRRITFEGDLSDYILASKRLRQLIEERGLSIDRMYAAHTSTFYEISDLEEDDPSN